MKINKENSMKKNKRKKKNEAGVRFTMLTSQNVMCLIVDSFVLSQHTFFQSY